MMKHARRVLKVLAISLAVAAISRGEAVLSATLPVVSVQAPIAKGLRTPTRLAVAADGTLYVADPANQGVLKFNSAGMLLQKIAVPGIPQGVAVTSGGSLLVSQKEFVALYDANGTEVRRLGSGNGQFAAASGIALDDTGRIYVADSKGGCVQLFDATGGYLTRFGAPGSGTGQLAYPTAIAYERLSQQIAVVDSLNARVQFYDKNGVFVRSIGSNGTGPLQFKHPQGLAFEYGAGATVRMYVADVMQKNIQAIDPTGSGTFLSYIAAGQGVERGLPTSLAFDQIAKRLYIIDGLGGVTVCVITDGSVVLNSVTPAPATATVIASSATAGSGATVAAATATNGAPFSLSMVADGTLVATELLDVTGLVTIDAAVTVNGQPVSVSNGLFSTAVELKAGANTITVTATDRSGRSWSESRTVQRGASLPVLTVAAPDVLATDSATLLLAGGAGAGVYVSVSGVPAENVNQQWLAPVNLSPGLNTIEVQGMDLDGQTTVLKRTVLYNPAAPALAVTAPAEDTVVTTRQYTISGTVSGGKVTAALNGTPVPVTVAKGTFTVPLIFGAEGVYTVTLTSVEAGGSISTVSRSVAYRKKQ